MPLIALGNYNNLAWFTCINLALKGNLKSLLITRERIKLRDEPLFEHPNISIRRVNENNIDGIKNCIIEFTNKHSNSDKDIYILSGTYLYLAKFVKMICPKSIIIYYPIGFEIEALDIDRPDRNLSLFFEAGASVDFVLYQDQLSMRVFKILSKITPTSKAIPYCRSFHVFRPDFIQTLMHRVPASDYIKSTINSIPMNAFCIFWASRLTAEVTSSDSSNNKGFSNFSNKLAEFIQTYRDDVYLIFIDRDAVSHEIIARTIDIFRFNLNLKIIVVPEQNYSDFCYILARSGVAIDSFCLGGELRVNMTTADAVSIGANIVSCFDEKLHSHFLCDSKLTLYRPSELFELRRTFVLKEEAGASNKMLQRARYLSECYTEYTEFAEVEFYSRLLAATA